MCIKTLHYVKTFNSQSCNGKPGFVSLRLTLLVQEQGYNNNSFHE